MLTASKDVSHTTPGMILTSQNRAVVS